MSQAVNPSTDNLTISLPSNGDGVAAEALLAELRAAGAEGRSAILTANDVDEMGTAMIQVIEAAAQSFQVQGLTLKLADPSDAFTEAYGDLGLFSALMSKLALTD
jgi:anti-anti-sigma regulatory factor